MAKRLVFLLVLLHAFAAHLYSQAQADTILVYDIATQTTATILPVSFNSTITSDNTSSSVGSMGNVFPLSLNPPAANLFTGANFSKLARAADFFSLTDYPMRTVVNLQASVANDTVIYKSTGMIVGPCFVLTGAVNVYSFGTNSIFPFNGIGIYPAYNNGMAQPGLPVAVVKKIYIFKTFYDKTHWDDIALLELDNPIGLQTGWTGIGFNSNPNFTAGKVYHKFSYPSSYQYNDSTKYYNGDTLYYNYGSIIGGTPFLSVNSPDAVGIAGQGGSTFLYTDNVDYYSLGLLSFSSNYLHYAITNSAFYQFKNVLMNASCSLNPASIHQNSANEMGLSLYPNPLTHEARLEFDYDASKRYSLQIVNGLGQQLRTVPVSSGEVMIGRDNLAPGIYFLQLRSGSGTASTCKLVVE